MNQRPILLCKGKEIDPSELPSCRATERTNRRRTTAQASDSLDRREKRTHKLLPTPVPSCPSETSTGPQWWTALNCLSVWRLHQDRCVGKMFRAPVSRLPSLPLQVYGDDAIVALLETPVRKLAKSGRRKAAAMRRKEQAVPHQTQVTRSSASRRAPRIGARLQLLRSLGRPQTLQRPARARSTHFVKRTRCFETRSPMMLESS
jgi:hypothetical protein